MHAIAPLQRAKARNSLRVSKGPVMSRQAIHQLRTAKLVASRTVFARLLKVSENTVFRWEAGKAKPDRRVGEILVHLNQVCDVLLPSMEPAAVANWLERPNPAVDNFRPTDLLESEYGRLRLKALIEETGLVVHTI
ncbi:MAG: hypothetical protein ACRD2O_08515 [Terriglobia bacterium]